MDYLPDFLMYQSTKMRPRMDPMIEIEPIKRP